MRGRGRRAKPLHLGPRFVAPKPEVRDSRTANDAIDLPTFTVLFDLPE